MNPAAEPCQTFVVAATVPAALTAVEAALARAGLLLPPRIEVVPAWAPWADVGP